MMNIANLLKNAPIGTKLWNDTYGELELMKIAPDLSQITVYYRDHNNMKARLGFKPSGKLCGAAYDKCVLFPAPNVKTWSGWQESLFKEGDFIVNDNDEIKLITKINPHSDNRFTVANWIMGTEEVDNEYISKCLYASPEQKQQMLDGLVRNGFEWDEELKSVTVIKPKDEIDFKDGDIIASDHYNVIVGFKSYDGEFIHAYGGINSSGRYMESEIGWGGDINLYRYATEEEIDTLREMVALNNIKPTQFVLVRDNQEDIWQVAVFSHFIKDRDKLLAIANSQRWIYCIPYDGNENLVGTNKNFEK